MTERILAGLPGPRLVWVVAWALVPWLNLAVIMAVDGDEWAGTGIPTGEILNRAAVSFAVLLSLFGAARITDELRGLRLDLVKVVEQEEQDVERLFRGLDSTLAPLLLTAAAVVVLPLDEAVGGEPVAAVIQATTWLVLGIPLWTAVWVYLTLQRGLNRLGRGHLTLEAYHGDRSLGLRPVGRLAFTGFWMLFGTVGPLVVTGISDVPGAVVGIGVLVAGVTLFFLSLRRLNRQMVAVKQHELERAVDLYRQAYQPVRDEPTLEVLQRQTALLSAAEALEKRAERIQEWPFDEATFARVVTIASSVAAVVIGRIILDPVGL
ncbi:MAG TPA: hypothetical protein VJ644_07205 [Jiangellaceae bacterium]|nr:hypothetical protein [Jiangellaceae bacterium]